MNREILFRGKQADNGEWATSQCHLGTMASGTVIHDFDPATVGQYTGLKDKAGNEIYEGDILKLTHDDGFDYYGNKRSASICCVVIYEETSFIVRNTRYFKTTLGNLKSGEVEVIGNVWDNPELLEETT